jgi:hypothetical protein
VRKILILLILNFLTITMTSANTRSVQHGNRELSTKVKAKVLNINYQTREITLQTAQGYKTSLIAGDKVKNFNQIKIGDTVVADYVASVEFVVMKGRKPSSDATSSSVNSVPGSLPSGKAERQMKTSVIITAIDRKSPSVTIKDVNGELNTFHVQHVEKLAGVEVGDQIDITSTEALNLRVER